MPAADEMEIGAHAMCIVGYNDKTKLFAVANSWGNKWGNNGFCFMPYDYLINPNLAGDFWSIRYYPSF